MKLIEASKRQFPRTAAWAQALHACNEQIDGLIWVSRQNDGTRSLVLFGDRVAKPSLRSIGASLLLASGPGFDKVQEAAEKAGILVFK